MVWTTEQRKTMRRTRERVHTTNPIKRYRLDRGIMQKDFAMQLGVARETLCRWENDVQGLSLGSYLKLKRLGVSL